MKFCKCVDQPHEYEKIVKLIEGGQGIAALDRINQLLTKTPNAAWLLAIKGELCLNLEELDTFRENTKRFLKLKPDNPLALIMRSMVSTMDSEPVENAARYLLDGLSESRESLPALTLPAIQLLIRSLAATGRTSMVGYWSDLLSELTSSLEAPESQTPLQDPSINLLAKAPSIVIEDPPGAAWKERLSEVLSLARTFRFAQAESKLRAILRDYPEQPGPLSHLLRAQCALLDQPGALATARKLSEHADLSEDERAFFTAVAYELEPDGASLLIDRMVRYCEIDSADACEQALRGLDFAQSGAGEQDERMRHLYARMVGDEVPAKRVFSFLSGPLKLQTAEGSTSDSESTPPPIATSMGSAVLFGKQTDRPARILFVLYKHPKYTDQIQQILDVLELGKDCEGETNFADIAYDSFLKRPARIATTESPQPLDLQQRGQQLLDDFLNIPIACLDHKSPLEAADDESLRLKLRGLLFHLEGAQEIVVPPETIDEIYRRLNVQRPKVSSGASESKLRLTTSLDVDRVRIDELSDEPLIGLYLRASEMGASRVAFHCARDIKRRKVLDDQKDLLASVLTDLVQLEPLIEDKLHACEELQQLVEQLGAPVGSVVLQRLELLHSVGRDEEGQQLLMQAISKYPEDPVLVSFVQYAMQNRGQIPESALGPGGANTQATMPSGATSEGASESGLVLPGQESASKPGESKLWLPGS